MEVHKVKSSGTRRLDECSKHNAYAAVVTYTPKSKKNSYSNPLPHSTTKQTNLFMTQCPYLYTTNQQPNSTPIYCLRQKLYNLQNNKDNQKQLQIHSS